MSDSILTNQDADPQDQQLPITYWEMQPQQQQQQQPFEFNAAFAECSSGTDPSQIPIFQQEQPFEFNVASAECSSGTDPSQIPIFQQEQPFEFNAASAECLSGTDHLQIPIFQQEFEFNAAFAECSSGTDPSQMPKLRQEQPFEFNAAFAECSSGTDPSQIPIFQQEQPFEFNAASAEYSSGIDPSQIPIFQQEQPFEFNAASAECSSGTDPSQIPMHQQEQPFESNVAYDLCSSRTDPSQIPIFQQQQTLDQSSELIPDSFSADQRQILEQQMRMHVQFATQNYLQLYKHPINEFRNQALQLKSFLTELVKISLDKSIFIENLQPSFDLIKKWEEDLSKVPDENEEYHKFVRDEYEKTRNMPSSHYYPRLPERMMNVVVESVAFPYPHLLPDRPFLWTNTIKISQMVQGEEYVMAFNLEKFKFHEYHHSRERFCAKFSSSSYCKRMFRSAPFLNTTFSRKRNEKYTGKKESNPLMV